MCRWVRRSSWATSLRFIAMLCQVLCPQEHYDASPKLCLQTRQVEPNARGDPSTRRGPRLLKDQADPRSIQESQVPLPIRNGAACPSRGCVAEIGYFVHKVILIPWLTVRLCVGQQVYVESRSVADKARSRGGTNCAFIRHARDRLKKNHVGIAAPALGRLALMSRGNPCCMAAASFFESWEKLPNSRATNEPPGRSSVAGKASKDRLLISFLGRHNLETI